MNKVTLLTSAVDMDTFEVDVKYEVYFADLPLHLSAGYFLLFLVILSDRTSGSDKSHRSVIHVRSKIMLARASLNDPSSSSFHALSPIEQSSSRTYM